MSDDFFSGKWAGEYRYGGETPPGMDKKAPIAFELQMKLEGDMLKGICVDDETKSYFEKPATIEGSIQDNTISFKKKYPHFWDHDDNDKLRFFPKLPARDIQYTGRFENGQFSGEWKISSVFTDETEERFEYHSTGFWHMEKVN